MVAGLTWTGSDPGSGVVTYQLQVSVDGGTFTTITLPSNTTISLNRTVSDGHSYAFRVRATDFEGNTSAYATGPTVKPIRFQEASATVHYTGSWSTTTSSSASGGHGKTASSTAARATFTYTARDFAWIATKTPTSGSAQVWVDGVLATTNNLRATSTTYRQLVFARHFSTLATHKIELRPIGGGRIDLDAFTVMR
jgi:hypothetical protein